MCRPRGHSARTAADAAGHQLRHLGHRGRRVQLLGPRFLATAATTAAEGRRGRSAARRVQGHHERTAPEQRRGPRHTVEPVVPGHVQQRQRQRPGQQHRTGRGHAVRPARAAPVRGLRAGERRPPAVARLAVVAPVVPVAVVHRIADSTGRRHVRRLGGLGADGQRLPGRGARGRFRPRAVHRRRRRRVSVPTSEVGTVVGPTFAARHGVTAAADDDNPAPAVDDHSAADDIAGRRVVTTERCRHGRRPDGRPENNLQDQELAVAGSDERNGRHVHQTVPDDSAAAVLGRRPPKSHHDLFAPQVWRVSKRSGQ